MSLDSRRVSLDSRLSTITQTQAVLLFGRFYVTFLDPLCVLALWKLDRLIARLKTPKRVTFSERILGFLSPWLDFCCGYVHSLNDQPTQTSQFSLSLSFNLIYLGQMSVNNLIQTCSSLNGDLKSASRQPNVKQTTYYANKNHLFL